MKDNYNKEQGEMKHIFKGHNRWNTNKKSSFQN